MGKHRPTSPDQPITVQQILSPDPPQDETPTARIRRVSPWATGALVMGVVGSSVAPAAVADEADTQRIPVVQALPALPELTPEQATERLSQLAASRSHRDAERTHAAEVQAAAEAAASEAEAKRLAEVAATVKEAAARDSSAPEPPQAAREATTTAGEAPAVTGKARITNSAGPVSSRAQAAADAVLSNVPGTAGITLGGTRGSAVDPAGHPSGNAIDYMIGTNSALGDAIVAYHLANWSALGVDYIIWEQRILTSPGGAWERMEDRGDTTANHYDHPHVNYLP